MAADASNRIDFSTTVSIGFFLCDGCFGSETDVDFDYRDCLIGMQIVDVISKWMDLIIYRADDNWSEFSGIVFYDFNFYF